MQTSVCWSKAGTEILIGVLNQSGIIMIGDILCESYSDTSAIMMSFINLCEFQDFIHNREHNADYGLRIENNLQVVYKEKTQVLMRRLLMYLRRCRFTIRCHRRRLLLEVCMITLPGNQQNGLALLFNDTYGGIMREYIAPFTLNF